MAKSRHLSCDLCEGPTCQAVQEAAAVLAKLLLGPGAAPGVAELAPATAVVGAGQDAQGARAQGV
jgi:hypothetical protein